MRTQSPVIPLMETVTHCGQSLSELDELLESKELLSDELPSELLDGSYGQSISPDASIGGPPVWESTDCGDLLQRRLMSTSCWSMSCLFQRSWIARGRCFR